MSLAASPSSSGCVALLGRLILWGCLAPDPAEATGVSEEAGVAEEAGDDAASSIRAPSTLALGVRSLLNTQAVPKWLHSREDGGILGYFALF